MARNEKFLALLLKKGLLEDQELQALLDQHEDDTFALLMNLVHIRPKDRAILGRLWGDSIGYTYIDLGKSLFNLNVVEMLPMEFARKNRVIPVYQFGDVVTTASSSPADQTLIQTVGNIMGKPISSLFALPDDIDSSIDIMYQSSLAIKGLSGRILTDLSMLPGEKVTREALERIAGNQAVIELTRDLILLALKERASDIHIDPYEDSIFVRYRIDGILQDRLTLDVSILPFLASRLKILATLDIVEKRIPQDGAIKFPLGARSVDIRFSSIPTIWGEKIVLRILGQSVAVEAPDLGEMDFSRAVYDRLMSIIKHPNGIFLVSGPTGSGKSTTLFSVLKHLNQPGVNIMTIEDPVEYRLPRVNQVQVMPSVELSFARALRAMLRQDPDIILVGEIRDQETARIASQAALTGHLVLATLHTNDSPQAVARLVEIGVEPSIVAPSMLGAMAQRLVRKICPSCKEKFKLAPEEAHRLFKWDEKGDVFCYRGKGCPECNHTGYSGRIAIHEILVVDDEIRKLISKRGSTAEIHECAYKHGFRSMRHDGLKKVLRGLTTVEEIDRITFAD